jgi:hypothetical protein
MITLLAFIAGFLLGALALRVRQIARAVRLEDAQVQAYELRRDNAAKYWSEL